MGHAFRLAKTILVLALGMGFFTIVGGLLYLNQVGFPGQYGDWVRSELSERGIHLDFGTLRFNLRRGLVATEVKFYAREGDAIPILQAQEITLDLDKTKALRGKFKLIKLDVIEGSTLLPTTKEDEILEASGVNGKITMSESGRLRLHKTTGLVEGVLVTIRADLALPERITKTEDEPPRKPGPTNKILHLILDELALWDLSPDSPPLLDFMIRGDLNDPDRINTEFSLFARNLKRNDYELKKLRINGDLRSQLVTLDTIFMEDESGRATGQADWSILKREGRFNLDSQLQFQRFLQSCFQIPPILPRFSKFQSPTLSVEGQFSAPYGEAISVQASGKARTREFYFLDKRYNELSSRFSWHNGDLFLQELTIKHENGELSGEIISKDALIRYDLESSLPVSAFDPFVKPGSKAEARLAQLSFQKDSLLDLDLQGTINRDDLTQWTSSGKAHLTNFVYKGTAIHELNSNFKISPKKQHYTGIRGLLDDRDEPARTRFRGKASQELLVDSLLVDREKFQVVVSNLRGQVWPSPVVRIFSPKVAGHLEKTYRFHQPPKIMLNGAFEMRKGQTDNNAYLVEVDTEGQTNYPFLGKSLPVQNLSANVTIKRSQISADELSFATVGGTASGKVTVNLNRGAPTKYRGSMKWDQLHFPEISKVYRFKEEEKGLLTGQIDFNGVDKDLRQFNAKGIIGITQGNLVSLPVLGPLSPIIAGMLGDKRMGYERAKDASATFNIEQGVWKTKDFNAVSTSITLTGEGWIDLVTDRMDMIVRVNARGLLGFLTLPLAPLKGMFQFRGTGEFTKPSWKASPFTRPAKGQADPIFQQAGKAQIIEE